MNSEARRTPGARSKIIKTGKMPRFAIGLSLTKHTLIFTKQLYAHYEESQ
jgi:hypothetical protein